MKGVVLTYHFGDHDNLLEPVCSNDWDFLCITNNTKLESKKWTIVYVEEEKLKHLKCNKRKSSGVKIFPDNFLNDLLEKYDYILNIDGNFRVRGDTNLNELAEKLLGTEYDIAIREGGHSSIGEEGRKIVECNRDSAENVENTITSILKSPDFDSLNQTLGVSNIILRKNSAKTRQFFATWYILYIAHDSIRDQLTFPFAFSLINKVIPKDNPIRFNFFGQNIVNKFESHPHHKYYY